MDADAVARWCAANVDQGAMGASEYGFDQNQNSGSYHRGKPLNAAEYTRFLYLLKASRLPTAPRALHHGEIAVLMGRSKEWGMKMYTRILHSGLCGKLAHGGSGAKESCTKLDVVARAVLFDLVRVWPNYTRQRFQSELWLRTGLLVHETTISRCFRSMGLTRNVRATIATQRANPQIQQYNAIFRARSMGLDPHVCAKPYSLAPIAP